MDAGRIGHIFGDPDPDLTGDWTGAVQYSPLMPGASALEDVVPGTLAGMAVLAPPGTLERRYTLALALRAAAGAGLTVLAPKDKGGSRLAGDFRDFGCPMAEEARKHHRICKVTGAAQSAALDIAIGEGAPRFIDSLGLWSQPGIFSWDRIDPGSALLAGHLPPLAGRGTDLGCGLGVLAHAVLASSKVTQLDLIDIDRRAVAAARRNVDDPRARFTWADARTLPGSGNLDFVVMNPPFHDAGHESRGLGQAFVQKAAGMLRRGGTCWLTANRHLPYEAVLAKLFRKVETVADRERLQDHPGGEMSRPATIRLDRLLTGMGYGSRKQVQTMARDGRIALDGAAMRDAEGRLALTADLATRLTVDGAPLDPLPGVVLMMNKPAGVTCSHKDAGPLVHALLPDRWRLRDPAISTVGRLDKDTSGLLLLTDDGPLLHQIISPRRRIEKRYRVALDRPLQGKEADIFASGAMMLNGETEPLLPAALEILGERDAIVTVTEGRYHQVRRMFAATGNHVTSLCRLSIGRLALPDDLPPGGYVILDPGQKDAIFAGQA